MQDLKTWQKLLQLSVRVNNVLTSLQLPLQTGEDPYWHIKDAVKTLEQIESKLKVIADNERIEE